MIIGRRFYKQALSLLIICLATLPEICFAKDPNEAAATRCSLNGQQPLFLRFEKLELMYESTNELVTSDPRECIRRCAKDQGCGFANFDGSLCQLIPQNEFQDEFPEANTVYYRKLCPPNMPTFAEKRRVCSDGFRVLAQHVLTGARSNVVPAGDIDACLGACLTASYCRSILFYDDTRTECRLFAVDSRSIGVRSSSSTSTTNRKLRLRKETRRLVDYVEIRCTRFTFRQPPDRLPLVQKGKTTSPRKQNLDFFSSSSSNNNESGENIDKLIIYDYNYDGNIEINNADNVYPDDLHDKNDRKSSRKLNTTTAKAPPSAARNKHKPSRRIRTGTTENNKNTADQRIGGRSTTKTSKKRTASTALEKLKASFRQYPRKFDDSKVGKLGICQQTETGGSAVEYYLIGDGLQTAANQFSKTRMVGSEQCTQDCALDEECRASHHDRTFCFLSGSHRMMSSSTAADTATTSTTTSFMIKLCVSGRSRQLRSIPFGVVDTIEYPCHAGNEAHSSASDGIRSFPKRSRARTRNPKQPLRQQFDSSRQQVTTADRNQRDQLSPQQPCLCTLWSTWYPCTLRCGGCGRRYRTRECATICADGVQTAFCNQKPCPLGVGVLPNHLNRPIRIDRGNGCCASWSRNADGICHRPGLIFIKGRESGPHPVVVAV